MYKCTECGTEYETKPDYCDCGNDTFEELKESAKEVPKELPDVNNKPEIRTEKEMTVKPVSKQKFSDSFSHLPPKRKTFSEQYPGLSRLIRSIDPISGVIFTFCIILALIVVIIPVKEPEITNIANESGIDKSVKNIPDINTFWNNTPPAAKSSVKTDKEEKKPEQTAVLPQIIKNISTKSSTETKKVQNPVKNTNTSVPKQTAKKTTSNTQIQKQKQTNVKTTPVTAAQPKTVQTKPQSQTLQDKTLQSAAQTPALQANTAAVRTQTEDPAIIAAQQAKKAAEAKLELDNYKVSLRNTIGRKIDFSRVIGDGDCVIVFRISQSGQLINRSFAKQSDNITLNNAVYSAVMATPSYNPPPKAYNNESLTLNIKIYNGNFEISLK